MVPLPFAKMNGIGNAILVIDTRGTDAAVDGVAARALGRDPQLRFDQLMAIGPARREGTVAFVDIFNIDGSRAGACGNGTRCVTWWLTRTTPVLELVVETAAGLLACRQLDARTFSVDMGEPRLGWRDIPLAHPVADTAAVTLVTPPDTSLARCAAVGMGNPHAVFFVPNAGAIPLDRFGPIVEHDALFPDRTNVSFAEIVSRDRIRLRVWERGAGATLACGSAACATTVAAVRAGLTDRRVRIALPGGELALEWRAEDGHVIMTGGVELEHEGDLTLAGDRSAR